MAANLAALVMAQVTNTDPALSALTPGPVPKRKRPGEASPSDLRRSKRTNMATPDPSDGYSSTIDTAQAAAAGVNVSDFNALQQAAADTEHGDAADPANASSTAAAALVYPTIHTPQPSDENLAAQLGVEQEPPSTSYVPGSPVFQDIVYYGPKPAVGSEEWHKMRKDNHKEVERRRRETINEGINELAKIVPGCEKNKGAILQTAVRYITKLREDEQQAIEKWTLEKLLTEQAIAELSSSNDKLKQENNSLWREMAELQAWKRVAENAGLSIEAEMQQQQEQQEQQEAEAEGDPESNAEAK